MLIRYTCDCCGNLIDTLEVDAVDEEKFGFDNLTAEEKRTLIKVDLEAGLIEVKSLCDSCIELLGFTEELPRDSQELAVH